MNHVLDNPVWEALGSRQAHLNAGSDQLRYFDADVAPFVALNDWSDTDRALLRQHLPADRSFSVMIARPVQLPESCKTILSLPLFQLVCSVLKPYPVEPEGIRQLGPDDVPAMLELTAATKPGPFYDRTRTFGDYYGIFRNGKLAAMAGERLKVNGYTEVSAICTDPAFAGQGLAACLLTKVAAGIIEQGQTPFLHVRNDNDRAIALYERTGFEVHADVHFAIFKNNIPA